MVALLRGVNVGGHRKLKMAELRELCESLDFTEAQTYVQSGNLVFKTTLKSDQAVCAKLANAIEGRFGFPCDIIVRNASEIESVIKCNPFHARKDAEPSKLLVSFFDREPSADARHKALAFRKDPEELFFHGKELYMYFPNGIGKAKTPLASVERALKVSCTGRNWNTVLKLLDMIRELG